MKLTRSHIRVVFGLVGLAFLVVAFRDSLGQAQGLTFPGPRPLILAFALIIVALFCAGLSWVALFDQDRNRSELFGVFFQAQPGKYIPGGVWQAAMQVGLSRSTEVSLGAASVAFGVHSITQLVAGLALGSLAALAATDIPVAARVVLGIGLLSIALLRTGWMHRAVRLSLKIPGVKIEPADVPPQGSILKSATWSIVVLIGSGLAFAILARQFHIDSGTIHLVLTFSASWAIGYLAVPFPAGVGVREGVMMMMLGANAASVIAASLVHRILTMVAEVTMLAAVEARTRWS